MMIRAAVLALFLAVAPAQAQSAADCARHLSPCHVDTRLHMAGIEDNQDARDFLAHLKAAARDDDRQSLAAMIRYPLTIYADGQEVATYLGAEALLADFDAVFTPPVMGAIEAAEYETLFVNDQGAMIGDGELWFDGWDGQIAVKAINP